MNVGFLQSRISLCSVHLFMIVHYCGSIYIVHQVKWTIMHVFTCRYIQVYLHMKYSQTVLQLHLQGAHTSVMYM